MRGVMSSSAYDAAYPNLAGELAAKPLFLCAYTDGNFAYGKPRVDQVRASGVGVLANHERAVDQLLTGGGTQAAMDAVAAVLSWGMPADGSCAIFYSVDLSVSPAQYPTVGAAFDQINAVHAGRFRTGVYGQGGLIDYLHQTGRTSVKGWLSASSSFPGYNPQSPNVGLYQLVGSDVAGTDKNIVTDAANLGVWWPNGTSGSGSPISEDDMRIILQNSRPGTGDLWLVTGASITQLDGPHAAAEQAMGVPVVRMDAVQIQQVNENCIALQKYSAAWHEANLHVAGSGPTSSQTLTAVQGIGAPDPAPIVAATTKAVTDGLASLTLVSKGTP
jgi:hypothetical protein